MARKYKENLVVHWNDVNLLTNLTIFFFLNYFSGDSPSRRVLFDYPGSPYLYGNYHPSPSEDLVTFWLNSNGSGKFHLTKTSTVLPIKTVKQQQKVIYVQNKLIECFTQQSQTAPSNIILNRHKHLSHFCRMLFNLMYVLNALSLLINSIKLFFLFRFLNEILIRGYVYVRVTIFFNWNGIISQIEP